MGTARTESAERSAASSQPPVAGTPAPRVLVLFDIDGTLLTAGGAPRRALEEALREVYGTPGPTTTLDFSGKTDPQIVLELLELGGFPRAAVLERLPAALAAYVARLDRYLTEEPAARLLPGVAELVPALAREPRAALGLLTGNVVEGARAKLAHFGLWEHFALGAFGSDHVERNLLPAVALARAEARWGVRFPPERTVVLGDTPRDIAAARVIGAVTVAIQTGRQAGLLASHGPDHLLTDLAAWRSTLWPVLFGEPWSADGGRDA